MWDFAMYRAAFSSFGLISIGTTRLSSIQYSALRSSCWTIGRRRKMPRSVSLISRSGLGMIQGAERWNRYNCPASFWTSGTNWIAEAPVPITATRLPVRS